MYSLGIDIGTSSVKTSLFDIRKGETVAASHYPKNEMGVISKRPGWSEQEPEDWWTNFQLAFKEVISIARISPSEIQCLGIAYQMHGLVLLDQLGEVVRPSIIWSDSRAVEIGEKAFHELGEDYCLNNLLNSPGNFTASKLRWVRENEPDLFSKIHQIMLPGDFLAFKLSGDYTSTESGMSEGIFWDYKQSTLSQPLIDHFDIPHEMIPELIPTFQNQLKTSNRAEELLGIKAGTPISYRAGDQPNNAYSLNVLNPGEVAATAGTSGVIYAVADQNLVDPQQRLNAFLHVNHSDTQVRNGLLLCVNGSGSLNSWIHKNVASEGLSYEQMNEMASLVPIGSDGLQFYPFGNGAERLLENRNFGAQLTNLDFNRHGRSHMFRAAQEGIAFALKYGFEILEDLGCASQKIRAGKANMFLSPLFREAFATTIGAELELFDTDGAEGAARGAAFGAGIYQGHDETFASLKILDSIRPNAKVSSAYHEAYGQWKEGLKQMISTQ